MSLGLTVVVSFARGRTTTVCRHVFDGVQELGAPGPTFAVVGPGTPADDDLTKWLADGCRGEAPTPLGFVAVHVDPVRAQVLAACGPRTEAALAYAWDDDRLVISTSLVALIKHLRWTPAVDPRRAVAAITSSEQRPPICLEGVRDIAFGHVATLSPGHQEVRRWYRPEAGASIPPGDEAKHMRAAITAAVEDTIAQDSSPVTVAMSGGLDSTTVAALAARLVTPRPVVGLCHVPSFGTPEPAGSRDLMDWAGARHVAAWVPGLRARAVRTPPGSVMLDVLDDAFAATASPIFNPTTLVWMRIISERALAMGSRQLLTGQQGNVTFSGPPNALMHYPVSRLRRWRRRRRATDRQRQYWRQAGVRAAAIPEPPTSDPDLRSGLLRLVLAGPPLPFSWQAYAPALWLADPFSDPRVARVALQVPTAVWTRGAQPRHLARQATATLLPDSVRLRVTRGAQGADSPRHRLRREADYLAAVDVIAASPSASSVLDAHVLRDRITERDATTRWEAGPGRVLALGLYLVWGETNLASLTGSARCVRSTPARGLASRQVSNTNRSC